VFWIAPGREKLWLVRKVLLNYAPKISAGLYALKLTACGLTKALLVCVDSLAFILADRLNGGCPQLMEWIILRSLLLTCCCKALGLDKKSVTKLTLFYFKQHILGLPMCRRQNRPRSTPR
jgi:hypothetical protein